MPKILSVIWSLDLGGAEQVVLNIVRGIDRSRFEPVVCCLNGRGRYAPAAESAGIRVHALDKTAGVDLNLVGRLRRLMRQERVALVHTHLFTANLWGRVAAALEGLPTVITEHNVDTWKGRRHLLADRVLARWTNRTVCVSGKVEEFYLERIAGLRGRSQVIHNGIDTTRFSPGPGADTRRGWGVLEGDLVVGTVGRLVPQKRHDLFLRVVADLRSSGVPVTGVVVGDGPLRSDIEAQIDALGLRGAVRLAGFTDAMPAVYRALDLFVLPSDREGLPMTILESMASGVPVLATAVGGVAECLRDGHEGRLVPLADSDALVRVARELLTDVGQRSRLAAAGCRRVREEFSIERMVRQHEVLYEAILRQPLGGTSGASAV